MAAAFSTADENAIVQTIDVKQERFTDQLSKEEFDEYYEIDRTVREILQGDYKRIALQFPDELLHDSVPIFRRLRSRLGAEHELYVLADTSYGSCCVDEVAAQHVSADAMVHYGHACLSLTSRLPVIYVFERKKINVEKCVESFVEVYKGKNKSDLLPRRASLRHEVGFTHLADRIYDALQDAFQPLDLTISYTPIPTKSSPVGTSSHSSSSTIPQEKEQPTNIIFYIGSESLALTNLLMTNAFSDVYTFDPMMGSARVESTSNQTNKLLMRRYAAVQKARDADVFGILIGTLGVASYLPLLSTLRALLSQSHKKYYTLAVGKLNPSKLANFPEIDCFVLVACPENSLLLNAKDYQKPIVTPFELELALRKEVEWTGRYVLDFEEVIKEIGSKDRSQKDTGGAESDQDQDQPQFSLVTGSYRYIKKYGVKPVSADAEAGIMDGRNEEMILRNKDGSVILKDSAGGEFLQMRTFRGLEVRGGEDAPTILEQGRSGIARGYQGEVGSNDTA